MWAEWSAWVVAWPVVSPWSSGWNQCQESSFLRIQFSGTNSLPPTIGKTVWSTRSVQIIFDWRHKLPCRWQQPSTLGRSAATWSTRPRALKKILIKSEWCSEMGWGLTFGPSSFPGRVVLWNPKVPKVEQHLFRFGIQDISEFYGSTEGNSNIINFDNTVGAVGFVPVLFAGILPLGPIKVGNQESYLSFW